MKAIIDQGDGVTSVYHDLGDRVVIQNRQDIRDIVEANKRQKNDSSGRMGEMVHVGRIPVVVMDQWIREDGINYLKAENKGLLLKKLEQRDNSVFKTHPGKFA